MTTLLLYEIQTDGREENDLAEKRPEKLEEMKNILFKTWEAEGPREWWTSERQKPSKGGTSSY